MSAQKELPKYRCHKEVWALKIKAIEQSAPDKNIPGGSWEILPEEAEYTPLTVTHDWFLKHSPVAGGYLVVYKDGYQSFSPAGAFEDGYTLID